MKLTKDPLSCRNADSFMHYSWEVTFNTLCAGRTASTVIRNPRRVRRAVGVEPKTRKRQPSASNALNLLSCGWGKIYLPGSILQKIDPKWENVAGGCVPVNINLLKANPKISLPPQSVKVKSKVKTDKPLNRGANKVGKGTM